MRIDEPYQKFTLDFDTKMKLENEYISNRFTFLIDNNGKTEKDFVTSKLESISFQIKERERKFNLSDNEFYQEFRNEGKQEEAFINNIDERENIKEFLDNRHSYHKVYYHPNNYIDLELIFYAIKLKGLMKVEEIPQTKVEINPFPNIFAGFDNKNYLVFKNYIKYVIDPYPDYSFIFQKMLRDDNRILKGVKHLDFMEWLNDNRLISSKNYILFKEKGFFAVQYLKKAERNNNYNLIIMELFE